MFVAAVEHGSGVVRGQVGSDGAGEILGARRVLRGIGVAGRVVTMDAPHCCPRTARLTVGGGHHVMPVAAGGGGELCSGGGAGDPWFVLLGVAD